jgi:uridine monophosphate synthetase
MRYADRADHSPNKAGKRLLQLMARKESNLSFSADVHTKQDLLEVAEMLGPHICLLKTHVDIIENFDRDLIVGLKKLAEKHQFLIFEDRKFADIGNTVKQQYQGGIYRIADWADIINAHSVPGPGIIEGLSDVGLSRGAGLLLLAEMSSLGTLAQGDYTQQTVKMALQYPEFVMGFISRHRLSDVPALIHMTPGVKLTSGKDNLGQQYITPETAICDNKNDVIIVGRGILESDNPDKLAEEYRDRAWRAYLNTVGK